jgi:hypothetical protein
VTANEERAQRGYGKREGEGRQGWVHVRALACGYGVLAACPAWSPACPVTAASASSAGRSAPRRTPTPPSVQSNSNRLHICVRCPRGPRAPGVAVGVNRSSRSVVPSQSPYRTSGRRRGVSEDRGGRTDPSHWVGAHDTPPVAVYLIRCC